MISTNFNILDEMSPGIAHLINSALLEPVRNNKPLGTSTVEPIQESGQEVQIVQADPVYSSLKCLYKYRASGPDDLLNWFFKEYVENSQWWTRLQIFSTPLPRTRSVSFNQQI